MQEQTRQASGSGDYMGPSDSLSKMRNSVIFVLNTVKIYIWGFQFHGNIFKKNRGLVTFEYAVVLAPKSMTVMHDSCYRENGYLFK